MDKAEMASYQRMVSRLRENGIRAELYLGSSGMKAQMKYADKRASPCAIIQGSDERARGEVQIKDLIEGARAADTIASNEEWKAARPALDHQGVQPGVGRGVVGLAGSADQTGERGEDHEGGQIRVLGQFVQVPGSIDLGTQDVGQTLRGETGQDAVVQHPGRVDHRGQRVQRVDVLKQGTGLLAIGPVRGHHAHGCAQVFQVTHQIGGAGRVRAAAAGQQ